MVSAVLNYDRSGRSSGTGTVIFQRKNDAARAVDRFNNVALDGRPMKLTAYVPFNDAAVSAATMSHTNGFGHGAFRWVIISLIVRINM